MQGRQVKINLGAGNDIRPDYINHDLLPLSGISVVHQLNKFPWPWEDNSIDEILAYDVLEHLDNFIASLEEIYRILKPGGICRLSVPYWNSWCAYSDPTHKRGFHETAFYFFDPRSPYCLERPYYSFARFEIVSEEFILSPLGPYYSIPFIREIRIKNRYVKKIVGIVGNYFISNLIHDLSISLKKVEM